MSGVALLSDESLHNAHIITVFSRFHLRSSFMVELAGGSVIKTIYSNEVVNIGNGHKTEEK